MTKAFIKSLILKNISLAPAPSILAASYTFWFIVEKPVKNRTTLYPISFHTDTKIKTGMTSRVSNNHVKCVLNKLLTSPIFGSKIQAQTIAITTAGVINGKKYIVLKISLPLILVFKTDAIKRGITTAKQVVEIAYTKVLINICKNSPSLNMFL